MFERAVALDPAYAMALVKLSMAHTMLFHKGEDRTEVRRRAARAAVDRALELAPELPQARQALGYFHYGVDRDYESALEHLALAARKLPSESDVLVNIGWIQRRRGDFESAVDSFTRALRLDPRNRELVLTQAHTLTVLRRHQEADALYERAIALAPDWAGPYESKALNQVLWNGDIAAAEATAGGSPVELDPWFTSFWWWRALPTRRYPELLATLDSRTEEVFEGQYAHLPKPLLEGRLHDLAGDSEAARAAYERALLLLENVANERPEDGRVRAARGLAYAGLGRREAAIGEARLAVELLPISGDALASLPRISLAEVLTLVGDHEAAVSELEYLLSVPGWVTHAHLAVDPRWDPLREREDFQALAVRRPR